MGCCYRDFTGSYLQLFLYLSLRESNIGSSYFTQVRQICTPIILYSILFKNLKVSKRKAFEELNTA